MRSLFFCIVLLVFSCKTQKSDSNKISVAEPILTLSFISKGEGIDRKAPAEFETYQKITTQKLGKNIFSEPKRWGREGEYNIEINLVGLKSKESKQILEEVKAFDEKYELVQLKEGK